jgi:hypothetical protein
VARCLEDLGHVGHALARHQRSVLVMEALARGIARYGTPKEVLTDQGRQYTAWRETTEFEEELRRNGIRHVKSRPQHPQTLGKIERRVAARGVRSLRTHEPSSRPDPGGLSMVDWEIGAHVYTTLVNPEIFITTMTFGDKVYVRAWTNGNPIQFGESRLP